MPINPVTNVTHFPIEQSAESSEERRRDQRQQKNSGKDADDFKKQQPQVQDASALPASNEEAALSSQYVDTPGVIDLLSHRPTAKSADKNPFTHIKNLTVVSDDKTRKKINKSL